jgi:hypothetical protein
MLLFLVKIKGCKQKSSGECAGRRHNIQQLPVFCLKREEKIALSGEKDAGIPGEE